MSALAAVFARDLKLAVRLGGGAPTAVLFFVSVVTLIPFAIGPDLGLLRRIAPAVLWLGALLASLLTLDRLFAADREDGSLDLLLMGQAPLEFVVATKALAHWLTTCVPLVVASPLLAVMLGLDTPAILAVAVTLAVGTPTLTFVGVVGAAVTVTLRRGGIVIPVLVLPLAIPTLIFGVAAAEAVIAGQSYAAPLTVLCALTLASSVIGTFAGAAALRHAQD